jgi:CRISPR-associated protein Cas6
MPVVDVLYPVLGTTLPTDHLYPLYTALTKIVPAFHDGAVRLTFASIAGQYGGRGLIRLWERSQLRVRVRDEEIRRVLPLAGKALNVADHAIRLGVPRVAALVPSPGLAARIVTFKHSTEPERFLEVARQKLRELGVEREPGIPLVQSGERKGEARRKVVRVKGKCVIGFALQVTGLTAEESLTLQEHGLGGRRRMGCGFFVPVRR